MLSMGERLLFASARPLTGEPTKKLPFVYRGLDGELRPVAGIRAHEDKGKMGSSLRARSLQIIMGLAYSSVLVVALVKLASSRSILIALALFVASYATGSIVPDFVVPRSSWVRVCGIGVLVLIGGAYATLMGGSQALGWAVAVMAYCAGNRFKAGALGSGAR